MELIILGSALIGLIILANVLIVRNKNIEKRLYDGLLFLLNVPILLVGLLFISLPSEVNDLFADFLGSGSSNTSAAGLILVLMALWGMLLSLKPIRSFLSRWMQIDPDSPVHALALVFSGYLLGQAGLTVSLLGLTDLADSAEASSVFLFVFSEALFAFIAFLGIGLLIRRNGREMLQRMGLVRPEPAHLLIGIGIIVVLVILQGIVGVIWTFINPEQAEVLDNVNTAFLQDIDTVWEWLLLALAAGIGEELLFRGALQPVLGLGFTSVLFAVAHVQYGYSPIIFLFIVMALILGLVRRYFNTTTAIFVHTGYDFTLGLLVLLAAYLEPLVGQV